MEKVVLWALVILISAAFFATYGYVVGVSVKDIVSRFRRDRPMGDESTYGEPDPTAGSGSDVFGGR